jgi:UDP-N-acetylglucosamine 1-carboxyvinyltransferase
MYEGRMFFVDRLIKMGANIIIADPHRVIISGPTPLFGRHTSSPDIRAGIALVIAALVARGNSQISMAELVDRGYEMLEQRLVKLGAKISRVS